jgi:hypothetical protein
LSSRREGAARFLATPRYNLLQLSIQQERAIDLLMTGQRDREVADELRIHRVTVNRWRLHHPGFQATLNQRRRLLEESSEDKLRELQFAVLDALIDSVRAPGPNRTRVALDLFRNGAARVVNRGSQGETDPDKIIDHFATELQRRAQQLDLLREPSEASRQAALEVLLLLAGPPEEAPTG